jgi:hypothetical protein
MGVEWMIVDTARYLSTAFKGLGAALQVFATLFVWLYLYVAVEHTSWLLTAPPAICATGLMAIYMGVFLPMSLMTLLILILDWRGARSDALWPPLKWIRDLPAVIGLFALFALPYIARLVR